MRTASHSSDVGSPVIQRLFSFAKLTAKELELLEEATSQQQHGSARRDILGSSSSSPPSLLMLDGWAYRSCLLADGRRQIIQFVLPGDLITGFPPGVRHLGGITALTNVIYCTAPKLEGGGLAQAAATSAALDFKYLHRQIVRLGRLNAQERILDWLLELRERLMLVDASASETFPLPLTQEVIADTLGLTSVHVNRTLQGLRKDNLVKIGRGMVTFLDRERCECLVGERQ
jgi:CRP-like cAMP-binding protein